jgi:hypothetical protein
MTKKLKHTGARQIKNDLQAPIITFGFMRRGSGEPVVKSAWWWMDLMTQPLVRYGSEEEQQKNGSRWSLLLPGVAAVAGQERPVELFTRQ